MDNKLIINKKSLKGKDGYKTFSIRVKDETVRELDKLGSETNRSRNELINILLTFAIQNCDVNNFKKAPGREPFLMLKAVVIGFNPF